MYCKCGCGIITSVVTINSQNKAKGRFVGQYRAFIHGHHRPRYKGINKIVQENQNKHLCVCGCGQFIKIIPHHFYGKSLRGIPQYIHGHHSRMEAMKAIYRKNNAKRIGPLSPRWKNNRDEVRGRVRCKVDFTKRQKKDIYIRDKGICQKCGIFCLRDVEVNHPFKANIDHVIPVEDGGKNDLSNGQVLCLNCHKFKHSAVAKRMNSGKPRTGNPEPSSQSEKVQRLLESSDTLNNQLERPSRK